MAKSYFKEKEKDSRLRTKVSTLPPHPYADSYLVLCMFYLSLLEYRSGCIPQVFVIIVTFSIIKILNIKR